MISPWIPCKVCTCISASMCPKSLVAQGMHMLGILEFEGEEEDSQHCL